MISIENEGTTDIFRMTDGDGRPHLILTFEDIDYDDLDAAAPQRRHLDEAIAFARAHRGRRLLVHCHAGRYRSAAVGLALLADMYGPGREREAVAELVRIRPEGAPNLIALQIADEALGRGGALHAAWMEQEAGDRDYGRRRQVRFLFEAYRAQERRRARRSYDELCPDAPLPAAPTRHRSDDPVG